MVDFIKAVLWDVYQAALQLVLTGQNPLYSKANQAKETSNFLCVCLRRMFFPKVDLCVLVWVYRSTPRGPLIHIQYSIVRYTLRSYGNIRRIKFKYHQLLSVHPAQLCPQPVSACPTTSQNNSHEGCICNICSTMSKHVRKFSMVDYTEQRPVTS